MQYQKNKFSFLALMLVLGTVFVQAQDKNPKPQRPTKYPTQFDKIIDTEDKSTDPVTVPVKKDPAPVPAAALQPSDALVQAVQGLTTEVKSLVNEVRASNVRQQVQTDILRMSRLDLRIDRYESELKTVRERLTTLETEYQTLNTILTPEGLEAQVSRMPYANKAEAIRQVKEIHETRMRVVSAERNGLRQREAEVAAVLKELLTVSSETEKRLQALESNLKKMTEPAEPAEKQEQEQ